MWVSHHHCDEKGWDLADVYRLHGVEQNNSQEKIPPAQDR